MENNCCFVCSRGLLKSTDFHSPNPMSSCGGNMQYLVEMLNSDKMFDGMSIYVCSELMSFFVGSILPDIKNTFVLVSGDSDRTVPMEILSEFECLTLINNPYFLKWFAQNTPVNDHPKIIQMPIGLDYHTISNNPNHHWKMNEEGHSPIEQEGTMINIQLKMKLFFERIPKIYINFSMGNDKFKHRKTAMDQIPIELMEIRQEFSPRTVIWNNFTEYSFVLSPFGMGMDCHRTWEILCLGAIPIIKTSVFANMFADLPVLMVNEWSDITEELLQNTIREFKNRAFNYDKLTLQYWVKQIKCVDII